MKKFIITLLVIIFVGLGIYLLTKANSTNVTVPETGQEQENGQMEEQDGEDSETVIGSSVDGRNVTAYHYGNGDRELLFVGGIHGGYSWNTTLVAFEMMDYLEANLDVVPENIKVTVIPVLNPDGLNKVVGIEGRFTAGDVSSSQSLQVEGRFNENDVDISRNFDCQWQPVAKWQTRDVDAGSAPFSEPESLAIKNYVEANELSAAVVWYSAAGGVYSSSCGGSIMPETRTITNLYAQTSGYPAYDDFDFYPTTGDMVNWLAKEGIPAISVLLTNHQDVEWDKNKRGFEALLQHYAQ